MNLYLDSNSPEETEKIAETMGLLLKGGEVIELISDLGGGKTRFVHGLAKGIKSKDQVASPSFTISRLYEGEKLSIHHFDFYRLEEPGLMRYEIADALKLPKAVIVVEWGSRIKDALPSTRVEIEFSKTDDDKRRIQLHYPKELSYLVTNYADTNN